MAGATVTVASKLPYKIALQLQEQYDAYDDSPNGKRAVKRWRKAGPVVEIEGCAYHVGAPITKSLTDTGFALTRGVDAEFWGKWFEQNKDNPDVKNGNIFASANASSAVSEAREKEKFKTGFEPLDPDNFPAEFQGRLKKDDRKQEAA